MIRLLWLGFVAYLREALGREKPEPLPPPPSKWELANAVRRTILLEHDKRRGLFGESSRITIDNDGCYEAGHPECSGWDGGSPRCQCGATRVRWRWDEWVEPGEPVCVESDEYIPNDEPDPKPGDVLVRGQVVNVASELGWTS